MVNMADRGEALTPGSRYEKSLGLLTTRFVSLLQKAKDGVLDLKEVNSIRPPRQFKWIPAFHIPVKSTSLKFIISCPVDEHGGKPFEYISN